jgi:hypothetical protein
LCLTNEARVFSSLSVVGKFPGPLIEANTGDRIVVKVTNNMVEGTAIHWHGMFQNGRRVYKTALVCYFDLIILCNIVDSNGVGLT